MQTTFTYTSSEWHGPGSRRRSSIHFRFWRFLKDAIFPPRGQRILPTVTGYVLIVMTLGLGMAGYNTASNILFIAVSLLLSTIIVSLILSWVNFHGVCWRIVSETPARVGDPCAVRIELRNFKKRLPTYALNFLLEGKVNGLRHPLPARQRLEPRGGLALKATFYPSRRGRETLHLRSVSSAFPFGFLRKTMRGGPPDELVIWPRRIDYRFHQSAASTTPQCGRALNRVGHGSEFVNLRKYRNGDSHRQIHWKASARLGEMMVQQFAAENQMGFILAIDTAREIWDDEAQFERLCSFVSSLGEDLYTEGRLYGAYLNGEVFRFNRRADMDFFQNRLAVVDRVNERARSIPASVRNAITFEPDPAGGVHACVGGKRAIRA